MRPDEPLRVIIGAGEQRWDGWIPTQREQLDLLDRATWAAWFGSRRADALLCEHVWEHLNEQQGRAAARLSLEFLKPGGFVRVAVPDANFPNAGYQRGVQIGGPGPADHPAADHQMVYTAPLLADVFTGAGFTVELLEYCDAQGQFHARDWDLNTGPIYRSLQLDHRNREGKLGFVSIVLDATKPHGEQP
ncbi:class I SAM-dependent methyltransferase [Deinococcus frigens]|uniref:class I SAM-dependent methyltransferase n=1 Tax=Deinococcus frigens TaxID=249403 RepID=UPI0004961188|nr:hypothetical protein [Deinococcus frigens]